MPHHLKMMAEALRILKNRDEALDCVQDALSSLWKARTGLRKVDNVGNYCMKTVANRAFEILQRNDRRFADADESIPSADNPATALERDERINLLRKAISTLPELERRIIIMKVFKGMSGDEIALATGLSNANVRVIIHRIRIKLKSYIRKFD